MFDLQRVVTKWHNLCFGKWYVLSSRASTTRVLLLLLHHCYAWRFIQGGLWTAGAAFKITTKRVVCLGRGEITKRKEDREMKGKRERSHEGLKRCYLRYIADSAVTEEDVAVKQLQRCAVREKNRRLYRQNCS